MNSNKLISICICIVIMAGCLSSCHINYGLKLNINNPDDKLFYAIDANNLEMAKEAIDSGANINNFKDRRLRERLWHNESESNPFLILLMRGGSSSIGKYLLECGIDVNYVNKYGRSLLSYCVEQRSDFLEDVIEKGANINYVDKNGYTALDYALKDRHAVVKLQEIEILLKHNAKILDSSINRLVNYIIEQPERLCNYMILKTLLEADNDVNIDKGIKNAIFANSDELIQMAVSKKLNSRYIDVIISSAAAFCTEECLNSLLEIFSERQTVSTDHLFRLSAMYGNTENMKYLLNKGANINSRDEFGYSGFELAAINNMTTSVKMFLELGADLTSQKGNKQNALFSSVINNNMEMFELLIPYRNNFNITHVLAGCIESGNIEALAYLLDIGADPNNGYMSTNLLGGAVQMHNWDEIKLLMERGANVNSDCFITPLTAAVEKGYTDITQYLIDNGANVNVSDNYSGTLENIPIITAIRMGQFDCLKILIENGAKITEIDYYNRTILEFAEEQGSNNIYNYLLECYR